MPGTIALSISSEDLTAFQRALDELKLDLDLDPVLPDDLRREVLDFIERPLQFCRVDVEPLSAGRAGEMAIIVKPSDRLINLVSAIRALDLDRTHRGTPLQS